MSFPQFPDGHVIYKITINEKGHDMFIGWQLEHVSRDKRKLYTAYYKKCLDAVQCTSCHVCLRPKSSKERIDVQVTENCPSCLKPTLIHVECHIKEAISWDWLFPMRIQKPARPVSDIDPNFRNLGTIKRFQRTYLAKNDKLRSSQPTLESAHMELADLTNEFPGYLKSADITPKKMCITFCAPDIAMKADFKKYPMLILMSLMTVSRKDIIIVQQISILKKLINEVIDMNFSGFGSSSIGCDEKKNSLDISALKGCMGIQVVDHNINFLINKLQADGTYTFTEIASITVPSCIADLDAYPQYFDDRIAILECYEKWCIPLPRDKISKMYLKRRRSLPNEQFESLSSSRSNKRRSVTMPSL
ncbi:hypothetical protein INT45_000950 [Circinella minor]|uniref:Uncharacterized protein n=1 Tax=Circinella minor TaxID=1195481 RepID=A0A8H7RWY1_9FUNG|nr:hypothetical protein INT45_000950 [Circinella minor]